LPPPIPPALQCSHNRRSRRRADFLVGYQDQALADRYRELVQRARAKEQSLDSGAHLPFTEAVAKAYFKTLAYKDEYEVARLHADSGFLDRVRKEFGSDAKVRFHLAPPLLPGGVDSRGRPRKREFGAWMIPVFRILAALHRLRATKLDPFARTGDRRLERELVAEFEQTFATLLERLSPGTIADATEIIRLYLDIRGFGPVKEQAAAEIRGKIAARLAAGAEGTRQAA
jgi:indolepyruvate ferredoxin oxidoreductase